jgi:membrane protease YdiL (CAAX protease family)
MSELDNQPFPRPPFVTFILVLLVAMVGFVVVGHSIGLLLAIPFSSDGLTDLLSKMGEPTSYPEIKLPMMVIQGSATLFGLIALPSLYWWAVEKLNPFQDVKAFNPLLVPFVLVLMISFIVVDSVIIEWNSNLTFPSFLKGFEDWARSFETKAGEVTKFLTTFDSFGDFVIGMIVIAVLPGIGEELVFRGFLQPTLHRATNNIHVAIWFSAILFSAIHMQFFGFVPRMLLGALFGYLYYWSGNLFIPMLAHFINNGLSVIGIYLYQQGKIPVDIEDTEAAPWPLVIICAAVAVVLLVQFQRYFQSRKLPAT